MTLIPKHVSRYCRYERGETETKKEKKPILILFTQARNFSDVCFNDIKKFDPIIVYLINILSRKLCQLYKKILF